MPTSPCALTLPQITYAEVHPGRVEPHEPFVTHPWVARDVATGARMLLAGAGAVVGMVHEQLVDITDPPPLTWGVSAHPLLGMGACKSSGGSA